MPRSGVSPGEGDGKYVNGRCGNRTKIAYPPPCFVADAPACRFSTVPLACLECESERALDGGDHTIYLGRVVEGAIVGDARPLVYYQGSYRTIA